MTKAKLKTAMTTMADQDNAAREVAEQLGLSLSTFYTYFEGDGQPKPQAMEVLRPASAGLRLSTASVSVSA